MNLRAAAAGGEVGGVVGGRLRGKRGGNAEVGKHNKQVRCLDVDFPPNGNMEGL